MTSRIAACCCSLIALLSLGYGTLQSGAVARAEAGETNRQPKSQSQKPSSRKQASKSAGKSSKKAKKKAKRKKRSNMPRGWQWPPSKSMIAEGERCLAHLTEMGVAWKRAKSVRKVATPIVVDDMVFGSIRLEPTFRKPPFVMDCLLAEALTEHSQVLYDQGVRVLRFSSIHSYRKARANGVSSSSLSRHALGLAVDVFEFVLEGDVTLVVKDHYHAPDGVLPAIEEAINGTGGFRDLLTPGNDPKSHDDHFHLSARMPRPTGTP